MIDHWGPWRFLLGDWVGRGGGTPGVAESGACSFALELNEQVIARRNSASYPAAADRPAFTHEDLLYIYRDGGDRYRAWYVDTEGHTIEYRATADGTRATFESEADVRGMRYRLRYEKNDGGVALRFDIAPPGADFQDYISGELERKR